MNFTEFHDFLNTVMTDNGFLTVADEDQSRKLYSLMEILLSTNKTMNLTAITEERSVVVRHFIDSLTVARFLPENAKIVDVGCGAGFPCLPLGVFRPDLSILALDSTEKRIKYVKNTAEQLELQHFDAIAARAEEFGKSNQRERFDFATARAVAALPALAELCLPLVRVGGSFIAMKAKRGEEELAAAERAIKQLGGEVVGVHHHTLLGDGEGEERLLIEIRKIRKTPDDLPRPWARILKKPL